MDILRGKPRRASYDNLVTILVPFQNRPRTDPEFAADTGGDRDLPLRGDLRMSERHTSYYHGNANSSGQARAPLRPRNPLPVSAGSRTIGQMPFRERLRQEFESRRTKNPRYSVRALAVFLETDHSTLAQILRGVRRVPANRIRGWAKKLGISPEEAAAYIAAGHAPDTQTAQRLHQLRHWTAEAMALTSEPAHWQILRLCRTAEFHADCRWIARQIGVSVDEVNLALSRLLRLGMLEAPGAGEWRDATGLARVTEREFRKLALARIRKESKQWQTP